MASSSSKVIRLVSSDGEILEVDEGTARMSEFVKNGGCKISLPKVNSATLAKVLEFCKHHAVADADSGKFNEEYLDSLKSDKGLLFDMLKAADYLKSNELVDVLCVGVAKMLTGMSIEDKRNFLGVENDFTPEEEAAIREENSWAFSI